MTLDQEKDASSRRGRQDARRGRNAAAKGLPSPSAARKEGEIRAWPCQCQYRALPLGIHGDPANSQSLANYRRLASLSPCRIPGPQVTPSTAAPETVPIRHHGRHADPVAACGLPEALSPPDAQPAIRIELRNEPGGASILQLSLIPAPTVFTGFAHCESTMPQLFPTSDNFELPLAADRPFRQHPVQRPSP
jgi:hypothetical protein